MIVFTSLLRGLIWLFTPPRRPTMDRTTEQDHLDQLDRLQRRTLAAREYQYHPASADQNAPSGPVLRMRLPTDHETDLIGLRAGMAQKAPDVDARFARLMVEHACIGWQGVTCAHVLPTEPAEPLHWSPHAVALVLDANPEWQNRLWLDMVGRLAQRMAARESAEKNSNAALPG